MKLILLLTQSESFPTASERLKLRKISNPADVGRRVSRDPTYNRQEIERFSAENNFASNGKSERLIWAEVWRFSDFFRIFIDSDKKKFDLYFIYAMVTKTPF